MHLFTKLSNYLQTLYKLGVTSVLHVALYRLACRCGLYRRLLPVQPWYGGCVFFNPIPKEPPVILYTSREALLTSADHLLEGDFEYFSGLRHRTGNPPDWFLDPNSGDRLLHYGHWSTFDEYSACDIKNVWEISRFEWVPLLARAWRLTNDDSYLATLNVWILDWTTQNPANSGPNWKCGQEASIRLINLLLAARLLNTQNCPTPNLVSLIAIHCARILPTIRYAVAQNNNHGTSEAAALFIGGAWLMTLVENKPSCDNAQLWRETGRRWLEDRVTTLVAADGSFSQYSVNYHRVLIDTLCQVELWRTELKERPFSDQYVTRCRSAVAWLTSMTDATSGDAPNMGANDGARLYDLSSTPYRDFRPSIQLASVLFIGKRVYETGDWDEPLLWLGIETSANLVRLNHDSVMHGDGGYIILRGNNSHGIIRFARFHFRPSHADCLHLDLWHNGINILRDGGTFSYNTEMRWLDYFSGTESHNTMQFDGRSQMPRIGRFLFGKWLNMDTCSEINRERDSLSWTGAYTDWKQAKHRRTATVTGNVWMVIDEIDGFCNKAVLRWRLIPDKWMLSNDICCGTYACLKISTSAPVRRLELTTGWESQYYQQKTELPVLEIEVGPGKWTIETVITLKD